MTCEIERLARAFAAELITELGPNTVKRVVELNRTVPAGVCASHDFCDANMTMERAFRAAMGREIDLDSDAESVLWSEAWDMAKTNNFWTTDAPAAS